MDQLIYLQFICLVFPMILMIFLLDSKSRVSAGYMVIGMVMCLIAGNINTCILALSGQTVFYTTIVYTPIVEELLKGIPVLFFARFISGKKERLLSVSMATGIGFAVFENLAIIGQNPEQVSFQFAIIRGLASALVHGICTAAIGYGLSIVGKRRKFGISGTFGLFMIAVTYHSIFNAVIQSQYMIVACVLPILTYIPATLFFVTNRKDKKIKM